MESIKDELIAVGKKLKESNLTYANFGNISCKDKDKDIILITVRGADLGELKAEDITEITLKEDKLKFTHPTPSSELIVHSKIYRANSEISAIIHTHTTFLVVLSKLLESNCLNLSIGELHYKLPIIRGKSGSLTLGNAAAEVILKDKKLPHGAIIKEHGIIAWGKNLKEIYNLISGAENAAKIHFFYSLAKNFLPPPLKKGL
jgi:L-fuculose-phosphate aldolase